MIENRGRVLQTSFSLKMLLKLVAFALAISTCVNVQRCDF